MKEAVEGCKKVAISSFHENCEVCEGKGHFFSKCHCKLNVCFSFLNYFIEFFN